MQQVQKNMIEEDSDLKKISEVFLRNYRLFVVSVIVAILLAFLINHYSIPIYKVSSSILIKENKSQQNLRDENDFLNSNLLGKNQNLQNELWVIKSSPVIDQTIRKLDLFTGYYKRMGMQYREAYHDVPFRVVILKDHPQPINTMFKLTFINNDVFHLIVKSKQTTFYNFETEQVNYQKDKWSFEINGNVGTLVETPDLAFIIFKDSTRTFDYQTKSYGFSFNTIASLRNSIKNNMEFKVIDKLATVIEINYESESLKRGIDIVNELMNVYSDQNLERKNHLATITVDYIEKQLNEISDSLSLTEDNLQKFRSSNQVLDFPNQASGISAQYLNLQNQLAELTTRMRYYDYVSEYLASNDNFSRIIVPSSIGIQDQLLNNLISELITAQSRRANLLESNQGRNPAVSTLTIQIENLRKTITENIAAARKTTIISIDEMNNRIRKVESEISRLPVTQRRLGNIERKYRLNDAIYNYLLEKRAEAKITKASNLPDNIIIEPAKMVGLEPISPNKTLNYLAAIFLGLVIPFSYVMLLSALNTKVQVQEDIEKLTDLPILGKITHSNLKNRNVFLSFPNSNISEAFRALRTNLDFYVKGDKKKVIMVTSCLEGEGKTFIATNLAMSYAQLGRKTILVDYDLRKKGTYFTDNEENNDGLSSYLINSANLKDIIIKSPHEKLDYIISGKLPPNPVELIALEKNKELVSKLKENYDIIVFDTTPLAQVTDAYLLMEHSELKLIIARQNVTIKKVFSRIVKDLQLKRIMNLCIVLNDNSIYTDQYGYGYGYKNETKTKSVSQRILHSVFDFYTRSLKLKIREKKVPRIRV